jgi:hypothetical protein
MMNEIALQNANWSNMREYEARVLEDALPSKRLRHEPIRFGKRAPREPIRFGKRANQPDADTR